MGTALSGGSLIEGTFMPYNFTQLAIVDYSEPGAIIIMADRNKLGKLSRELKESDSSQSSRRQLIAVFSSPGEEELVPYAKLFSQFILFQFYPLEVKVNALWLMTQIIQRDHSGKAARHFAPKIYLFLTKCSRNLLDDEAATAAVITFLLRLQSNRTYCDSFINKLSLAGGQEFNQKMRKQAEALLFRKYSRLDMEKLRVVRKVPIASEIYDNYSSQMKIGSLAQEVVAKQENLNQGSLSLREASDLLQMTKQLIGHHTQVVQSYEHSGLQLFHNIQAREAVLNPQEHPS